MLMRRAMWALSILALSACVASSPPGTPAADSSDTPLSTARAGVSGSSETPTASAPPSAGPNTAERCGGADSVLHHDAPALEAVLPGRVAGRDLATWSVAGRCWLEVMFDDDAVIEDILIHADDPSALDLSRLALAVAGRSDTSADPPYFVFAANRPGSKDEALLTLGLLLGGARFRDVEAGADLGTYEKATIGGKEVYVGTPDMLAQNDHQRGTPYRYQTDEELFLVITDDPAWAEDAIEQLP